MEKVLELRHQVQKGLSRAAKINQIREELRVEMHYENQQYIEKRLVEERAKMEIEFHNKINDMIEKRVNKILLQPVETP